MLCVVLCGLCVVWVVCCVVLCVLCVVCVCVRVVCVVVVSVRVVVVVAVDVAVCVRFFLSCIEERSRVYVQNAPLCTFKTPVSHFTWERLERTHGSVLKVVAPSLSPSLLVSLSSHLSLFLSLLISHSFSSHSTTDLNNNDNDRSSNWVSLYTWPYLAEGQSAWVNMFASSKKLLSQDSCASLVPLGMKWACICAERKNVLGGVVCLCCVFL